MVALQALVDPVARARRTNRAAEKSLGSAATAQ
jgi:hypothetical protein